MRDLERGACLDGLQQAASRSLREHSRASFGRHVGPELQQHQTIYVLIDTGARLDSRGNSLVADSDPNFAVAEQVIVPKGTMTFQESEVSTTTTIAISFTVLLLFAGWNAYSAGPGDPHAAWGPLFLEDKVAPWISRSENSPTSLTCGSKVAVVVNEGTLLDLAGHETALRFRSCLLRCACSCTQTQPITMPIPILTKKDRAMNGWHWRGSVSVLGMMCWYAWEIRRIRRKPKSVHVEGLLTWEDTRRQIL